MTALGRGRLANNGCSSVHDNGEFGYQLSRILSFLLINVNVQSIEEKARLPVVKCQLISCSDVKAANFSRPMVITARITAVYTKICCTGLARTGSKLQYPVKKVYVMPRRMMVQPITDYGLLINTALERIRLQLFINYYLFLFV